MIRAKLYVGQPLHGEWQVTRKLDGVRALRTPEGFCSRAGKPLYNLDHLSGDDLEIFAGSWEASVSLVRTRAGSPVPQEFGYSLDPLDARLDLGALMSPSAGVIASLLEAAIFRGDEGLVLRQEGVWLKVKSSETYDVPVTAILPGKGKHVGKVGALVTPMGNVGTGLSDALREELRDCVGLVIEVECMELTPGGKFRHPRFRRVRFDKQVTE